MSAPTALYRRYRPDSFAQVIGQEHVTAPLMAALEKNRVNHAYLFSGPRGCGKTTSARILARCLNCAKGPTAHPCGECESCVELARGGSGSLDVIEIDAASHGGVDDARDLRERATFAPIRDRYKIFIIDEAHMVTSAGFNALLKIVEEPPEHIKFIFATTEPDKVIGTIRSRTHHYPFRLVPPEPLMAYLAQLCEQEGMAVAPGVLSLVVRAGGGSVRDSLSVLDQLMAGAGPSGLDYDLAVDLLGYTHASLLDDVVEALAAADSATVFKSIDRVIQTGHDPRRFVEDLLERFRDLIIVQAMPESAHAILRGTPEELIARMQTQAAQLGAAELSRAADVTNEAFNVMTGATSPRLHLELLGARLLLPGADASARGMATRLDQLERRFNYGGAPALSSTPAPGSVPGGSNAAAQESNGGFAAPAAQAEQQGNDSSAQGGGLAAVRAQLAKAKEAAGAQAIANRNGGEDAPPAPVAQTAPAQQHQPERSAAPVPNAADEWATPMQSRPGATTWDDLPTPTGPGTFAAAPQQQESTDSQSSSPDTASSEQAWGQPQQPAPQQSQRPSPAGTAQPGESHPAAQNAAPSQQPGNVQDAPQQQGGAPASSTGIEVIRRAWPDILTALRKIRMASWAIVTQNVVPQTFDGEELRVGLPSSGLIATFSNGGHQDNLQQAINQVLGMKVQILPADGEAPKASAEPNPKVRAGSPSQQREGAQPAAPTAATPAPGNDSAQWNSPARNNSAAAPVTRVQQAPPTQAPWDGPTEPSDPWDEPYQDVDHWDGAPAAEPSWHQGPAPASLPDAGHLAPRQDDNAQEAARNPAPQETPDPYAMPKVSPITAWTTGWDSPAESTPTTPEPAAEPPKRSALLAAKMAEQSGTAGTNAAQDWGVSLGQAKRSDVADPGWGDVSAAPDWAKPSNGAAPQADTSAPAATQPAAQEATPDTAQTIAGTAGANSTTEPETLSRYQRLAQSSQAQAGRAQAPAVVAGAPYVEDIPSPDDETIEESAVVGQAAVERILGGVLVEERPLNPTNF